MSEVGAERGRTHPVMRSDERRDHERMIRHVWIKLIGRSSPRFSAQPAEEGGGACDGILSSHARRGQSSCSSTSSSCLIRSECPSPSSLLLLSSAQQAQRRQRSSGRTDRQASQAAKAGRPGIAGRRSESTQSVPIWTDNELTPTTCNPTTNNNPEINNQIPIFYFPQFCIF